MEELSTDILVIGSGLSGLLASLEAEKSGLRVLMTGKFAIGMGTNTSLADGNFTVSNSRFTKEDHLRTTLTSGMGLNRVALVKTLVDQGPDAIRTLKAYQVPLVENETGYRVDQMETPFSLQGIHLMKSLLGQVQKSTIQLLAGLCFFDLVVEKEEVQGAFGFLKDGRPCLIRSRAVVLAAGGAGAIYRRNDNQKSILGDGFTLALRAGLPVFDLEFVQFFPLVLGEPRLPACSLYPPYPKEMKMINEQGKDLLESLSLREGLDRAVRFQQDHLSLAIHQAAHQGDLFLNLTQVPQDEWEKPLLRFLKKVKFPFGQRPFLIAPAAHFFMGGVEIDEDGKTSLPGLFAAGEVTWGVHGASRIEGNSLTECAVFGSISGRSAAEYVRNREREKDGSGGFSENVVRKWNRKIQGYIRKHKGMFDPPRDLLKELKELAWNSAGPVRDEASLKKGLDRLTSIEQRIEWIYPDGLKDLFRKRNLENAALLIRAILTGSLLRTESRGAFSREDFPNPDEPDGLKNTCYRLLNGELHVSRYSA